MLPTATTQKTTQSFSFPANIPEASQLKTMIEKFYHWEKSTPDNIFLRQPYGNDWVELTFAQAGLQARKMASWIREHYPPKTHVGIVSKNHTYWILADLAIMMSDCISVPFFPTLNAEQLNQVLTHSDCKLLFVGKLDVWDDMKGGIPSTIQCITMPDSPAKGFLTWEKATAKTLPMQENFKPTIQDIFTIIYTSGTTGMPKGAMLTYYNTAAAMEVTRDFMLLNQPVNKFISYLPLSHIAERCFVEAFSLDAGGVVSFVESIDTFAQNLRDVQPTHFLAVPRIWIKFHIGILGKMPQKKLSLLLKIPVISSIVKKKILQGLGLSNCRLLATGAAPMSGFVITWFQKLGIIIQDVYGMTENHAACTMMRANNIKIGTVGQPFPGAELRIKPETGEILMKAPWIMKGYYKEVEKTKDILDNEGWLHTGDIGELDSQGFLTLTGRVKDTFKTTKGEFIIPSPIEWGFTNNHFIEQICVTGRTLDQPVALVVLSDLGRIATKEEVNHSLESIRKSVNAGLANYARIGKIIITKEPWSVENGILTPTLKIKRNVLEERYQILLDKSVAHTQTIVWEDSFL